MARVTTGDGRPLRGISAERCPSPRASAGPAGADAALPRAAADGEALRHGAAATSRSAVPHTEQAPGASGAPRFEITRSGAPAWPELPPPGAVRVTIDDPPLTVDLDPASARAGRKALVRPLPSEAGLGDRGGSGAQGESGTLRLEVVVDGWRFEVAIEPARRAALRERATRVSAERRTGPVVVRAPLPGRVSQVWVAVGDVVERGQRVLSLEAMKMENEVATRGSGTVQRVSVAPGTRVELGDELVVIG